MGKQAYEKSACRCGRRVVSFFVLWATWALTEATSRRVGLPDVWHPEFLGPEKLPAMRCTSKEARNETSTIEARNETGGESFEDPAAGVSVVGNA